MNMNMPLRPLVSETSRRLTSDQSCDFNQFTDMVHSLLNAAWGADWGTFTQAFPNGRDPQNVKLPVITYLLKEKRPGVVGNRGAQEIKPRFRQEVVNEEVFEGGPTTLNIYSQVFDHDVVFEVWEDNNDKANKLAEQFEDFMMIYKGYFKRNGVGEIIFDHMNNDAESPEWKDNVVVRKFRYLVRLEKHTVVPSHVIEKVTGSVIPMDRLTDDSIDSTDSSDSIKFKL